MRSAAVLFLLGVLALHGLPGLPDARFAWALAAALPLALLPRLPRPLRAAAVFLCGFLWALARAPGAAHEQLPAELVGEPLALEGWIAELPAPSARATRLVVEVARLAHGDAVVPFRGRVQLAWYEPPTPLPAVGERWAFGVRLARPRGFSDPGAFDYARKLYADGIHARGSVRAEPAPQRLAAAERYPLTRLRARIADNVHRLLPDAPAAGVILALTIGDESGIAPAQWDAFFRTGTGHLMAISGQQVALIAALVFALVRYLWPLLPGAVRLMPALRAAALAALLAACGYALLAGCGLPAQRAAVMVAVAMLAVWWQRELWSGRTLALALLAVLVGDPLAPLSAGFWLSFGAVAVIIHLVSGQRDGRGAFGTAWRLQWAITLGLLPVTLVLFGRLPLLSPLANLIAIPWVDVAVVPLALAGTLVSLVADGPAGVLLAGAAAAVEALMHLLDALARPGWSALVLPTPPAWTLALALPGAAWLLAPPGWPARWLGALLCLPLFAYPYPRPAPGGYAFALLDVGDGLAAVVRTARHTLVVDTGPRLGASDAGRLVLLPYLQAVGVRRIDTLLLSHRGGGHTGGARTLRSHLPVARVLAPVPAVFGLSDAADCAQGLAWEWDGVRFEVLHPPPGGHAVDGPASCVLRVAGPGGALLLPGDIDAAAEAALAARGEAVRAEILVAPHRGTRTPRDDALLRAVAPRFVLLSTGYANRYDYPRPATVAAYTAGGARLLDTARDGAILFDVPAAPSALTPLAWREAVRRHWDAR